MNKKYKTWWAIQYPRGTIVPYYCARTRKECIQTFTDGLVQTWLEFRKEGYKAVKILVRKP